MIRLIRFLTSLFSRDNSGDLKFSENLQPKRRWRDSEIWMIFWIGMIFGFGFNLASWILSVPIEWILMTLEFY